MSDTDDAVVIALRDEVTPALKAIQAAIEKTGDSAKKSTDALTGLVAVKVGFDALKDVVGDVEDAMSSLLDVFEQVNDAEKTLQFRDGASGIERLHRMVEVGKATGLSLKEATEQAQLLGGAFKPESAERLNKLAAALHELTGKPIKDIDEAFFSTTTHAATTAKQVESFVKQMGGVVTVEQVLKGVGDSTGQAIDLVAGKHDKLSRAIVSKDLINGYARAVEQVQGVAQGGAQGIDDIYKAGLDAASKDSGAQANRIKSGLDTLEADFATAVFKNPEMVKSLKDFADELDGIVKDPRTKAFFDAMAQDLAEISTDTFQSLSDIFHYLVDNSSTIEKLFRSAMDLEGRSPSTSGDNGQSTSGELSGGGPVTPRPGSGGDDLWNKFKRDVFKDGFGDTVQMQNLKADYQDLKTLSVSASDAASAEAGVAIDDGLAKGIKDAADHPVQAAHDVASQVQQAFKDDMQVHSPSRLFEGFGYQLNAGLAIGIDQSAHIPVEATTRAATDVSEAAALRYSTPSIGAGQAAAAGGGNRPIQFVAHVHNELHGDAHEGDARAVGDMTTHAMREVLYDWLADARVEGVL